MVMLWPFYFSLLIITAKQLRPIALTDVSYKLFMTIIGKKIDAHLLENHEKLDTQAGFTTGSMIEDNLFTMQYCIERSFKLRRPLIVTCLDYSKAFDSIKREKLIETLIHYKVHYKIIVDGRSRYLCIVRGGYLHI